MRGRTENAIKDRNRLKNMLVSSPSLLKEYGEILMASREPKTCLTYIGLLLDYCKFVNKDVSKCKSADIARYMDHIRYKDVDGETVEASSATRQLNWSALNQFYEYLVSAEYIKSNPVKTIPRPKTEVHTPDVSLSMKELNKLLDATSKANWRNWPKRDKLILYTLMVTGMRRTALTEININDIDIEKGTLVVIDKRNKKQIYYLDDKYINLLNEYLEERNKYVMQREMNSDALFVSYKSGRITPASIRTMVSKYSQFALGKSISPHKLRASFVTLYYEASGHDIVATCKAVGHANIETTNRYIKGKNDSRKKAMAFMSKGLM